MRRYIFAAIVMAIAVLATALPAYAASAVLTVGSPGGPAVAPNDVLHSGLLDGTNTPSTFKNTGNSNQLSCKVSTFKATAVTNPAPPGPATESLTNQDFDTTVGDANRCTTNFGPTVKSITIDNLPYNVSVSSPSGGNNVTISPRSGTIIHATVVVTQIFDFTCKYKVHDPSGNLFGKTDNTNNTLTLTSQQFDKETGPSVCFPSALFSAQYGAVKDQNQSDGVVVTN
jgi:hypothetical protein